jgi:hypothetical protein
MNENKIAFIICYNDELYMSECMKYINRLNVPYGVETDIIGIQGAESMCAGYNAGMNDSDAKYKVYMHQDVFILNENFIVDIIKIFRENPDYGLLGVYGTEAFVSDANYIRYWNRGILREGRIVNEVVANDDVEELTQMDAVDGLMLVTQYDLPWREDIFDGFDFYDISQGMEFRKAGYKVGVPRQGFVWCQHDCGAVEVGNYDFYRRIFCREYGQYGYKFAEYEDHDAAIERNKIYEENICEIERRIEQGDDDGAHAILENLSKSGGVNSRLAMYYVICEIMYMEKQAGASNFYNNETNRISDLVAKLTRYKFFLRRVEHGFPLEDDEVFEEIATRADKRLTDLCAIALHVTLEPEAVMLSLVARLGM